MEQYKTNDISTVSVPTFSGLNKINTPLEFTVNLEARHINNEIRSNIQKYIEKHYLNKGYGLNFILKIDYNPIYCELPLLPLDNISPSNPIYPFNIVLNCECLYFNINQEIQGNLTIEHGDIPNVIVYNNYIRCNVNKTPNMQVNISDKTINVNNKTYGNEDQCIVKIENLKDSTKANVIIAEGIIVEEESVY